jgi:hypothetical protein
LPRWQTDGASDRSRFRNSVDRIMPRAAAKKPHFRQVADQAAVMNSDEGAEVGA